MVTCKVCREFLTGNELETDKQRYDRILEGMRSLFPNDRDKWEEYAWNYIGRSRVTTYQCGCGVVTSDKPHQHHWYFREDLQWQKK